MAAKGKFVFEADLAVRRAAKVEAARRGVPLNKFSEVVVVAALRQLDADPNGPFATSVRDELAKVATGEG